MIAESGGMVGLILPRLSAEDGVKTTDTSLEVMIRHLDHMIVRLGEDHIGLDRILTAPSSRRNRRLCRTAQIGAGDGRPRFW